MQVRFNLVIHKCHCLYVIFKVNGNLAMVLYRTLIPCMISWHWFPTRHAPTIDAIIRLHLHFEWPGWASSALISSALYSFGFNSKEERNSQNLYFDCLKPLCKYRKLVKIFYMSSRLSTRDFKNRTKQSDKGSVRRYLQNWEKLDFGRA